MDYVFFGNQDLGELGLDRYLESRNDPYYDDPIDDPHGNCDHVDVDIDGLGRAECNDCGAHWYATTEECEAYDRAQVIAAEHYDRVQRRERWLRLWRIVTWHLWHRWRLRPVPDDDEIPF